MGLSNLAFPFSFPYYYSSLLKYPLEKTPFTLSIPHDLSFSVPSTPSKKDPVESQKPDSFSYTPPAVDSSSEAADDSVQSTESSAQFDQTAASEFEAADTDEPEQVSRQPAKEYGLPNRD